MDIYRYLNIIPLLDGTGYGIVDKGLGNKEMVSNRKGNGKIIGTMGGTIKSNKR